MSIVTEYEALSPEQQDKASPEVHFGYTREKGKESLWFFLNIILENPVLWEPLHKPIVEWLEPRNWTTSKKLLLVSRGHVKSNIVTIAWALWKIVRDPNIRILIGSHKEPDAKKFLRTIKSYIESERFQHFYPEIKKAMDGGKPRVWNATEILVERTSTTTENTVEVFSQGADVTGRHYELIILDDLVTRESTRSSELIKATKDFHELLQNLLDPGGLEIMLGTRYDYSDEYGRVLEDPELSQEYDCKIIPYSPNIDIVDDFLAGKKWNRDHDFQWLAYPSRYTLDSKDWISPDDDKTKNRKSLPKEKRLQGPTVFANQIALEPRDPGTAPFLEQDIVWIDPQEWMSIKAGDLRYFQVCDLSSETPTPDSFTVIVMGAVDATRIYITDIWRGTYSGIKVAQHLIDAQCLPQHERPARVGMEPGPYEKALQPWLRNLMREQEVFVPIKMLPRVQSQKSKNDRIMGLESWVADHRFCILRSCPNAQQLVNELVKFPAWDIKDVADACAQIPHIMYRPHVTPELSDEEKKGPSTAERMLSELRRNKQMGQRIGNDCVTAGAGMRLESWG